MHICKWGIVKAYFKNYAHCAARSGFLLIVVEHTLCVLHIVTHLVQNLFDSHLTSHLDLNIHQDTFLDIDVYITIQSLIRSRCRKMRHSGVTFCYIVSGHGSA